jgi:hypothetical protein
MIPFGGILKLWQAQKIPSSFYQILAKNKSFQLNLSRLSLYFSIHSWDEHLIL